jgi:hypothetical protein
MSKMTPTDREHAMEAFALSEIFGQDKPPLSQMQRHKNLQDTIKAGMILAYVVLLLCMTLWAGFQTYAAYTRYQVAESLTLYELLSVAWPWLTVAMLVFAGMAGVVYTLWSVMRSPSPQKSDILHSAINSPIVKSLNVVSHQQVLSALSTLWQATPTGECVSNLVDLYNRGIENAEVTVVVPSDTLDDGTAEIIKFSYKREVAR